MNGWFRWYAGTVSDNKLLVVARRSQQSRANVIALWAMLLENAFENNGCIAGFDLEAADIVLDMADGTAHQIIQAMSDKGMIADSKIVNWEKRQWLNAPPKSNAERQREFRKRQRNEDRESVTECNEVVTQNNEIVTQSNESVTESNDSVTQRYESNESNATVTQSNEKSNEALHKSNESNAALPQIQIQNTDKEEKNTSYSSCPVGYEIPQGSTQEQGTLIPEMEIRKQSEQPVITLPLNDDTEFPITQKDVQEWSSLYPDVSIEGELRRMRGWLLANAKKTKRGIRRFVNQWLDREQNKPHSSRGGNNANGNSQSALAQCAV